MQEFNGRMRQTVDAAEPFLMEMMRCAGGRTRE
jgi:hypothetical protein